MKAITAAVFMLATTYICPAQTMDSGTGTPSRSVGNNGDLYRRTDVPSVYGPKASGAWPSTFSYIVGQGCTTVYHIDKDCDGYGVGPKTITTDPNPIFGPDADDSDATVNTPASVLTKYGSINAFLTHLGFPTNRVFYIDPNSGVDASGCGTVTSPCQHFSYSAIGTVLNDGAGGTVMYRAGSSAGLQICTGGGCYYPHASSSASPVVIMAYPGEQVTFLSATAPLNGGGGSYNASTNVIFSGFSLISSNPGNGYGVVGNWVQNITLENSELAGWSMAVQFAAGSQNTTITQNLFHDIAEHAVYPVTGDQSQGVYSSGLFNCSTWTWHANNTTYNPHFNFSTTNNVMLYVGSGGYDAIHYNGQICGGLISGNVLVDGGGSAIVLQDGNQNVTVSNNLIANNSASGITINIYGCENNGSAYTSGQVGVSCDSSYAGSSTAYYPNMESGNKIINNTVWTGLNAPSSFFCTSGCATGYYGIDIADTSEGVPGGRWIENTTIQNNLLVTFNGNGGGVFPQLWFGRNSYPETNTLVNNLLWNAYPGNSSGNVMQITSNSLSCSAAPWYCTGSTTGTYGSRSTYPGTFSFSQFQSYNTASNTNELWGNPAFADVQTSYSTTPNMFNFRLASGSPAIGAGLASGAPATDITGATRASTPSIGAYDTAVTAVTALTSLACTPALVTGGASVTCTVTLSQAAGGGVVMALSSGSAAVVVPASVTISAGASSATFNITVGTGSPGQTVVLSAAFNGATQTASLTFASAAGTLTSLACSPTTVASGAAATCTLTLSQPAGSGGITVNLSSNTASVTVPATVSVAASSTTAQFSATAGTVSSVQSATISAQYNGASVTATVSVQPAPANTPTTSALQLNLNASEVGGLTNGSVVTPTVAPAGFTGSVVVNGAGSVNFTPAQSGNGVYFLNCCSNTGNAYYQFTGATLGSIFNATQGQISFYLQSRYSWAQRQANATGPRYSFDVLDGNGTHQLYFFTQPNSGYLTFITNLWGNVVYYYVPQGTENTLFGNGVILQVTISWNAGAGQLYLNNTLVKSFSYTPATPNWTAASNFDLGAYQYQSFGGYNSSDDVIAGFSVIGANAAPAAATLSSLACTPSSISSGATATCNVILSQSAGSGGITANLSSNMASVTVPATVSVAAGSATAQFSATAGTVSSTQSATISAQYNGASVSATVSVQPPASPGSGTPLTNGTWTMVPFNGWPISVVGYDGLTYGSGSKQFYMWNNYHNETSESNEAFLSYSFQYNRWDVLAMGGPLNDEDLPGSGHPVGDLVFNSSNNTLLQYCCWSGSDQYESANQMWWFDPIGLVGRNQQTPTMPGFVAENSAVWDATDGLYFIMNTGQGLWSYNPATNAFTHLTPSGVTPISGAGYFSGMAWNSANDSLYLFGGNSSNNLYQYSISGNSWTLLSPSGTPPSVRQFPGFAYDSRNNIFLMVGGEASGTYLCDTWVYDPTANSWKQLTPARSPVCSAGNTTFSRLAYDADDNVFMLVWPGTGGYAGGTVNNTYQQYQNWFFRYGGTGNNVGYAGIPTYSPSPGSLNRNTTDWALQPVLAVNGSTLYASWIETGTPLENDLGYYPHIYASQYSAGSWSAMGSTYAALDPENSGQNESKDPTMAIVNGVPWLVWDKQSNTSLFEPDNLYAKSWSTSTSTWSGSYIPPVTSGSGDTSGPASLIAIGSTPYVAFLEIARACSPYCNYLYVDSYNGSAWSQVGTGALNRGTQSSSNSPHAVSVSLATDGTNPYVAWTEFQLNTSREAEGTPQVFVSEYVSGSWTALGGAISNTSNWAQSASIAYRSQPYVAYTERTQTGVSQVFVKTWNGSAWSLAGSGTLNTNISTGWAEYPYLFTDGTSLYCTWVEQQALGQKMQVYVDKWNGSSWTPLGGSLNADIANGSAEKPTAVVYNGQPVVAWGEVKYGSLRNVYIRQWNGASWTFALGATTPPSACDLNGDGVVNSADVQLAINQAIGLSSCTNADLHANGQCTVVDVQRVINASLGGSCKTGP